MQTIGLRRGLGSTFSQDELSGNVHILPHRLLLLSEDNYHHEEGVQSITFSLLLQVGKLKLDVL